MFCPKCGRNLPDNALFCCDCGFNVSSVAKRVAPTKPQIVTETHKAPEAVFVPETPAAPEAVFVPETPAAPEAVFVPETPAAPEAVFVPETPAAPEAVFVPETPAAPEAAFVPETPAAPEAAFVPETPAAPEAAFGNYNNGAPQSQSQPQYQPATAPNSGAAAGTSHLNNAKKMISAPLIMTIAIILSLASVFKFFAVGFDILLVLVTVGTWIAFAGVVSKNTDLISTAITLTSVSVKIQYILNYVVSGLIVLIGGAFWAILSLSHDVLKEIVYHSREFLFQLVDGFNLPQEANREVLMGIDEFCRMLNSSTGFYLGMLVFSILCIAAVFILLFNVLFTRQFSKYLSKASRANKERKPVVINDHNCGSWVLAYGILTGVGLFFAGSGLGGLFPALYNSCIIIVCILASILMKKDA